MRRLCLPENSRPGASNRHADDARLRPRRRPPPTVHRARQSTTRGPDRADDHGARPEGEEVGADDRILVMGPGPIGHFIAVMAREAGAKDIVVVGKDDTDRLASMKSIGFDQTIDLADGDLASQAKRYIRAGQFDIVFEATGVPVALQQGLDVLRRFGVMVTCAIHSVPAAFDVTKFVRAPAPAALISDATWKPYYRQLGRPASQHDYPSRAARPRR